MVGEGQWRHQGGELSEAKERELVEVVAEQQKTFEQQRTFLPHQKPVQPLDQKQELEV